MTGISGIVNDNLVPYCVTLIARLLGPIGSAVNRSIGRLGPMKGPTEAVLHERLLEVAEYSEAVMAWLEALRRPRGAGLHARAVPQAPWGLLWSTPRRPCQPPAGDSLYTLTRPSPRSAPSPVRVLVTDAGPVRVTDANRGPRAEGCSGA